MGRHFFPAEASMPADDARETLGEAEVLVASLRSSGAQALELLHLIDKASSALDELAAAGLDVRPERSRLETVKGKLNRQRRRFVSELGAALENERASVQPDRERWWWFLDETVAQDRRQRVNRILLGGAVAIGLLVIAGLVYEFFIAPPPEQRRAYRHSLAGENLALTGDLEAALVEFEAAVALDPQDAGYWVWIGVLRSEVHETGADLAFEAGRELHETELNFLIARSQVYQAVGNLERAIADVEQAVLDHPDSARAYFGRANIKQAQGDRAGAIEDLEKAAELAAEAGDVKLEGTIRYQLAMLLMYPSLASTPTPREGESP